MVDGKLLDRDLFTGQVPFLVQCLSDVHNVKY